MQRLRFRSPSRFAAAAAAVAGVAAAAHAGPEIGVREFSAASANGLEVRVSLAAQATEGSAVGSYCIRIAQTPASSGRPFAPTGFADIGGLTYLVQPGPTDGGRPAHLLADGGPADQDPRPGHFSTTFDTAGWPDGRYVLLAAATNRPGTGDYTADSRAFTLTIDHTVGRPSVSYPADLENGIIYQQNGIYACFPSLVRLDDGRFVTEFGTRTRASHMDFTGGTAKRVTADGGRTWRPYDQPIVNPNWRTADGSLVIGDADGWQFTTADQQDRLTREGRFTNPTGRPNQIGYLGDAHYRVSTDDGKTWTRHPIPLPADLTSGLMHFHDDTSRVITRDHVHLTATYGRRRTAATDEWEIFFVRSADDGKTWSIVPMTPAGPAYKGLGFNETSLIELPDGRILAMMRTQPEGNLYSSTSTDQGLTWSKPAKTPIVGWPCHLLHLADGRLLCAYGYRLPPMGIRACLSTDDGRTWDTDHEIVLRADGAGSVSDIGYPRVAQLPDGKVLTVYYMTTDLARKRVHIAYTRWTPPARQPEGESK